MLKQYPAYKFILAGCDYVLLLAAWALAISLRFSDLTWVELLSRPLVRTQGALIVVYSLVWIVIFQHFSLYKLNFFMSFGVERPVTRIFPLFPLCSTASAAPGNETELIPKMPFRFGYF